MLAQQVLQLSVSDTSIIGCTNAFSTLVGGYSGKLVPVQFALGFNNVKYYMNGVFYFESGGPVADLSVWLAVASDLVAASAAIQTSMNSSVNQYYPVANATYINAGVAIIAILCQF